jgi:DNA-binding CsgD family transcriptional regulator
MDVSSFRGTTGGWAEPALTVLLDALEEATWWDRPPPAPHSVLCLMAARTVGGLAAGHARYDAGRRRTQLTIWRRSDPAEGTVRVEQEDVPPVSDWWTTCRGRRVLLDLLGQRYLAELPLDTDVKAPTVLVVGRQQPLTEADADRLAAARRALCAVEAVIERLRASGAAVTLPHPVTGLTGRELEVLQMLAEGLLARSIAQRLEVSERTVHKHLGNVYRKLDAHDRLLAVRRAESLGLVATASSSR